MILKTILNSITTFIVASVGLSSLSAFALPLAPRDYVENEKSLPALTGTYGFDGIIALIRVSGMNRPWSSRTAIVSRIFLAGVCPRPVKSS
jgi:hypothetical protein